MSRISRKKIPVEGGEEAVEPKIMLVGKFQMIA
jgi:hypothetical protein